MMTDEKRLNKIPRYKGLCDVCDVSLNHDGRKGHNWTKTYGWRIRGGNGTKTAKECYRCPLMLDHFVAEALKKSEAT